MVISENARWLRDGRLCLQCGTADYPWTVTKGSFGLELILWLALILPGLIYSCWRVGSRYPGCPRCKSPNLVPLDSPAARAMWARSQGGSTASPLQAGR